MIVRFNEVCKIAKNSHVGAHVVVLPSDYAVAIFHDVLQTGKFECYLRPDTRLPMMYIKDCLRALWEYMVTPAAKLKGRVYNVTAMSFTPEELAAAIAKQVPEIKVTYRPDSRQMIGQYGLHGGSSSNCNTLIKLRLFRIKFPIAECVSGHAIFKYRSHLRSSHSLQVVDFKNLRSTKMRWRLVS
jgi:nucleoside-diphosphate-sugar epimerase